MSRFTTRAVSFLAPLTTAFVLFAAGDAAAQSPAPVACFPTCREGFVCSPAGLCVSECNPPCPGALECRKGACVSEARSSVVEGPTPAVLSLVGGPSLAADKRDAGAGAEVAVQFYVGFGSRRTHALVLGLRGGGLAPLSNGSALALANLDIGYRARLALGRVMAGPFVLLQPGVWGGSRSYATAGLVVGGFVQIGAFELQIPIGAVVLTQMGSSGDVTVGARASLLGGVAF